MSQIVDAILLGYKKQVGNCVREFPVDLLGHGHVEAAQPGFDVRHSYSQFCGSKRCGDRGIHIAYNQNHLRFVVEQNRFDALHDFFAVCTAWLPEPA